MFSVNDEFLEAPDFWDRYFATNNLVETVGSAEAYVGSTAPDNIGAIAGLPTATLVTQTSVEEVAPIVYSQQGAVQYDALPESNPSSYVPIYNFGTPLEAATSTVVVDENSLPLGLSTTSLVLMAAVAFFYFKGA